VRMFEHAAAEIGDGELARGPQQQTLAELCFEVRDATRHGRLGLPGSLCRAAEAALVHHAGEEQKVIGLEVHAKLCAAIGTMLSI